MVEPDKRWPKLNYTAWRETLATLHMWLQIVGKVRLRRCPLQNHSWHTGLTVTARGLSTALIPHDEHSFQIDFDFIKHELLIRVSNGAIGRFPLQAQSTAQFYALLMEQLRALGVPVRIHPRPNEVEHPIPFTENRYHCYYDPDAVRRFWTVLLNVHNVMQEFRSSFLGKCSPVAFFWGGFDLAVTRFSGRRAPPHPGGLSHLPDAVTREAYSHELCTAGFWPGCDELPEALFYCYAYPSPAGIDGASVQPSGAYWHPELRQFVYSYAIMRQSPDPRSALLRFLQSSYEAAANLAGWQRGELECGPPTACVSALRSAPPNLVYVTGRNPRTQGPRSSPTPARPPVK